MIDAMQVADRFTLSRAGWIASELVRRHPHLRVSRVVNDALAFLEDLALFTRTGAGGCAQVRTRGMIAAGFDHWDTRTGDPNLHTHVVLANKVQGTDVLDDVIVHLAANTLEQVITRRSTWTCANVLAEAACQTRGLSMASVIDRHDLHTRVVQATPGPERGQRRRAWTR